MLPESRVRVSHAAEVQLDKKRTLFITSCRLFDELVYLLDGLVQRAHFAVEDIEVRNRTKEAKNYKILELLQIPAFFRKRTGASACLLAGQCPDFLMSFYVRWSIRSCCSFVLLYYITLLRQSASLRDRAWSLRGLPSVLAQ